MTKTDGDAAISEIEASSSPTEREQKRMAERATRSLERGEALRARSERRTAEREAASRLREEAREQRRKEDEERRTALATEREGRPRRRASGALAKTGEAKVVRDTSHYGINKDVRRIRELSRRGATRDGLAKVFGMSIAEIEAVLAGA